MQRLRNQSLFREACFINGKWVQADSGKTFAVNNPFDGNELGKVPECHQAETKRAIEAANHAWEGWKNLSAKERSDLLWAWARSY